MEMINKRKIYKLHRICSLVIGLPVLLWATSGLMHPVMTNIRPWMATQAYIAPAIDTAQLKVSIEEALRISGIDSVGNVRVVHMGGQQFYQVQKTRTDEIPRYFSTLTGRELKNGDDLYARYLGRYFLEGPAEGSMDTPSAGMMHDCCLMATMRIMESEKGTPVNSINRLLHFSGEYKYINRLLPVYRVGFGRADGIRIFVETTGDRFSLAVDNNRAAFDTFFGWFHTWEWMKGLGDTRYYIMVAITLVGFLTTVMGLYIFFTTHTKKPVNPLTKARRNHRYTSLAASLFTLLFTFSGGYHAFSKIGAESDECSSMPHSFAAAGLDIQKISSATGLKALGNVSLVSLGQRTYWRVVAFDAGAGRPMDLMKDQRTMPAQVSYVDVHDGSVLAGGDEQYARYLAGTFSGHSSTDIQGAALITKFTEEYGFVNKRLPVWQVRYGEAGEEKWYIEAATSTLAAKVSRGGIAEGYSFALFHKHHFMDFAGKTARDISTMFWAAMQLAMVTVGLVLWRKSVRRRSRNPNV
jgi:PepSY-associated TM region